LYAQNGSYVVAGTVNGTNYEFYFQVCGNVVNPPSECSSMVAPFFQVNPATKDCIPLGDINTYAFHRTNSQNGVMLNYYNGAQANAVTFKESRLYLECGTDAAPTFEHEDADAYGDQYHFYWSTSLACQS